jgi:CRP-like cAMP-binding protein
LLGADELPQPHHFLVKRLQTGGSLAADEVEALRTIIRPRGQVSRHNDIVREGTSTDYCTLILSGLACRYKLLPDGARQIHAFKMPGDVPDLYAFILGFTDHAIGALTSCEVAGISHDELEQITRRFPNIARALWRESLIDAAIAREWLTGLGRRDAYARVAHLICEQYHRMKAVELAQKDILEFPVTQAEIADALGLSTVHVNRTMKSLSRDKLISYHNHSITVLNWQTLQKAAQFDPAYLHSPPRTTRDEILTRGIHAVGLLSTSATN